MSYTAILTNIGLAKIADAIANDTSINITTGKVGDGNGNPVNPDATWTNLTRVVYTGSLDHIDVDPSDSTRVFAELVIPAATGGWTIREVGLYDSIGDLIAVAAFPEVYKPTAAEGATIDLIVRLVLDVSNTAAITLQVDTSIIVASRSWVTANFNLAALIPGGTTHQILRKKTNADGDTEWADPTDVNVVVNLIQEEQTLASGQTTVTLATATTQNAAVYIEGARLFPEDWTATSTTVITLASSYSAGSKILIVQNEPAGENDYLRSANNLSDLTDIPAARTNLELLTNSTYLDSLWQLMQQRSYPVGEILTTRRAGNPATWMGFGTWTAYAQGRVLVGYDGGDASFNALDKTGGAKTHVLTVDEMPPHNHDISLGIGASTPSINKGSSGSVMSTDTTSIASKGGGQAHNNLQPYITVYMWQRTA